MVLQISAIIELNGVGDRVLCEIQGTWYDSVVNGIYEVGARKEYQIFVIAMSKW